MVMSPKKRPKSLPDPTQKKLTKWVSKYPTKPEKSRAPENTQTPFNIKTRSKNVQVTRKSSTKKTLVRFDSASSDDLPTFQKKAPTKSRQTESFKKYGVIIPSVDKIIAEKEKLLEYKKQVQRAQDIKEPVLKFPLSPKKHSSPVKTESFDCKHLSLDEIKKYFNKHLLFLCDIFKGKIFSERHKRFYEKKNITNNFTIKDLTYNTSTIVFTFEQLDYIVSLMKKQFDPEDVKTCYFFQVLLPEFCLKVFMETHNMNKREANSFLEKRPI